MEFKEKKLEEKSNKKVQIHRNSTFPQKFAALAVTYGNDIYFQKNQEHLLSHELGHVFQQRLGLVKQTEFLKGYPINQSKILEKEADNFASSNICLMHEDIPIENPIIQCEKGITEGELSKMYIEFNILKVLDALNIKLKLLAHMNMYAKTKQDSVFEYARKVCKVFTRQPIEFYQKNINLIINAFETGDFLLYYDANVKEDSFILFSQVIIDGNEPIGLFTTEETLNIILSRFGKQQEHTAAINKLKQCCNERDIKKCILGANMNFMWPIISIEGNKGNDESKNFTKSRVEAYVSRLSLTASYIERIYNNYAGQFWVIPTGSDPHTDGMQVLFLKDKLNENNCFVHKGHSLQLDEALTGKNSILDNLGFSTYAINSKEHTEEVVEKVDSLVSEREAMEFAYQLGCMETVAYLIGIGDLHCDNIMFTSGGPVIIDAEVAFLQFGKTLILDSTGPIRRSRNGSMTGPAASLFYVEKDGKIIESTDLFQFPVYKYKINLGRYQMFRTLDIKREEFKNSVICTLRKIEQIRMLPYSTIELAQELTVYLDHTTECNCEEQLKNLAIKFCERLKSPKIFPILNVEDNIQVMPEYNAIFPILKSVFNQGVIPIIQLNINDEIIYMNDKPIAWISVKSTLIEIMEENITKKMDDHFMKLRFEFDKREQQPLSIIKSSIE